MKTRIFYVVMALVLTVALAVPLLSPGTAVTADTALKTQLAMILDGSASISDSDWTTIVNGLAAAVGNSSCVPHDGSVELTVVQFAETSAQLEVGPVVLTGSNVAGVAANIAAMTQMKGATPMACGICLAADKLFGSPNFDPALKQALNLVTDGVPNVCCCYEDPPGTYHCSHDGEYCLGDNYGQDSAECARNYAISLLEMTEDQDEFDVEGIGITDTNRDWLKNNIIFPATGYSSPPESWPPPGPGWVRVVDTFQEFADTICEKFQIIVEPRGACCDWATGDCTDDVLEADCQGTLEEWTADVLCANLDPQCEPPKGACCDWATGICTDDVFEADCQGTLEEWTEDVLCAELDPQCEPPKGACCDWATGICTDDVFEADCQGTLEEWTEDVLCANLDPQCEPPKGACCDWATGICTDDVFEADCQGTLEEWTEGESCAQVECEPPTGACCNPATGICTDPVLEENCQDPLQWTEGVSCAQIECVKLEPNMTIDKDVVGGPPVGVAPGGTVQYIISVTNTDTATAINVSIWDTLGTWFTYASTDGISYTGGAGYSGAPEDDFSNSSQPTWKKFTIPSGGSVVITFTADVDSDIPVGTYQNTAYADGDNFDEIDDIGNQGYDADTPPGQDPEVDENVFVAEEPPPQVTGVPTLSQWGMIAMGILFAAFLIWTVRRRWVVSADGRQE